MRQMSTGIGKKKENMIMTGGLGKHVQHFFQHYGTVVVVDSPQDYPQTITHNWLKGILKTGRNVCDHLRIQR